jgi:hypothetical protein
MEIFNNRINIKKFTITPAEQNSSYFINIKPASEFLPEWYRTSDSKVLNRNTELIKEYKHGINSTYKKCTPFLDAMTFGYISFLTADLEVSTQDNGFPYIQWRTDREILGEHTHDQWKGLPYPDGYAQFVYKWHNQMSIKVPNGYSLLFTNPINRFDLPFTTISGVVDADVYTGTVHFPFFIKKDFNGIIPAGTPISHIIPIKRESWKIEIKEENVQGAEIFKEKYLSTIKRSYKNNFWHRKEYR